MSLTGENTELKQEGESKPAFVASFTNGALQQLEELSTFFGKTDHIETVELAISFLELVKKSEEAKPNDK
jgi:hypothetical protein